MALDCAGQGGRLLLDFSENLVAIDEVQAKQKVLFRGELELLLQRLPAAVRTALEEQTGAAGSCDGSSGGGSHPAAAPLVTMDNLSEIYIQSGRLPEAIFADDAGRKTRIPLTLGKCTEEDIEMFRETFADDEAIMTTHRKGIAGTLHRLSILVHPTSLCGPAKQPRVIGVTARVGRSIFGILEKMAPQVAIASNSILPSISCTCLLFIVQYTVMQVLRSRESLLLIGRPGVGKTTVLREFARMLSADRHLVVVVVDKTNEIGGTYIPPSPARLNAAARQVVRSLT